MLYRSSHENQYHNFTPKTFCNTVNCLSRGCDFPGQRIPSRAAAPPCRGPGAPPSRHLPPLAAGPPGRLGRRAEKKPAKFILESVFPSTNSTERKAIQVGNAEGKQKSCTEAIFKRKDLPAGSSAPGRAAEEVSTGVGNRYQ